MTDHDFDWEDYFDLNYCVEYFLYRARIILEILDK